MALGPGDIVFVGWDADNEDISFVATAPVAAGEVIYFTDDEWDGTSFVGNEQLFEWVVPAGGLAPGDVVTIDMVRANQPGGPGATIDIGGDVDYIRGGGALANGNEMFWAFQGDRVGDAVTPTNFISVIGAEADGNFTQTPNLAGTGLTTATGAVIIDGDEDYMEFNLDADAYVDQASFLATVGDPANWVTADGGGNNNPNGLGFDLDFANFYCFTPGAMIETPDGQKRVEMLRPGDLVATRDHGPRPIRRVLRRSFGAAALNRSPHLRPIRIGAGAFGPGAPDRDLLVSPQHRFPISGRNTALLFAESEVLATAASLCGDCIFIERAVRRVTYIHLLFDGHEIIFANGLATESYHPGEHARAGMDAATRAELGAIFPDLTEPGPANAIAAPALRFYEGVALTRSNGRHGPPLNR